MGHHCQDLAPAGGGKNILDVDVVSFLLEKLLDFWH